MLLTILLRRVQQLHKALACFPGSFLPSCWMPSDGQGCYEKWEEERALEEQEMREKETSLVEIRLCKDLEGTWEPPQRRDTHSDPTHKDTTHFPLRRFQRIWASWVSHGFYSPADFCWVLHVLGFSIKFLSWGGMWYYETRNITINLMSYFLWKQSQGILEGWWDLSRFC